MIGRSERRIFKRDPDCEEGVDAMEFRLTYEGLLLGASRDNKRAKHKHEVRRAFHPQLKRLHSLHPAFDHFQPTTQAEVNEAEFVKAVYKAEGRTLLHEKLANFSRCGYRFLPLATRDMSLLCSVHILFLRPDVPGGVIRSGDIDNRMKTIFDALRMPSGKDELGGYDTPSKGEDPFFCLLEDDSLISQASIETDTLLQPTGPDWEANDARLVLTVRLSPYRVTWGNIGFG